MIGYRSDPIDFTAAPAAPRTFRGLDRNGRPWTVRGGMTGRAGGGSGGGGEATAGESEGGYVFPARSAGEVVPCGVDGSGWNALPATGQGGAGAFPGACKLLRNVTRTHEPDMN